MKKITLIILILASCLFSCRPKKLEIEALHDYLRDEENGLLKKEKVGDIVIESLYRPSSLLLFQELKKGDTTGAKQIWEKYDQNFYFLLNFSLEGKELLASVPNQELYNEIVQKLSFRMGEFINLTTSKGDTIPLKDYAFQNTYGMAKSNSLIVAFEREDIKGVTSVQLNMVEFGLGIGAVHFIFDTESLESIPELIF